MRKRYLSVFLAVGILMAALLSAPASAADGSFGGFGGGAFFEPWNQVPDSWQLPNWTQEEVTCTSGSETLSGTLTRPANAENCPVAILLHGLCTDRRYCEDLAWYLADRGIASVRFDFAGTGESTGAQEDMTISTETRDALAILSYVQSLSFVDTDQIYMIGKSMGGLAATLAAGGREDEVAGLVLWYPGFSLPDGVRHGFLLGRIFDPFHLPETVTVGFYTFGRDFLIQAIGLDWEQACRNYDGPVLLLHGNADIVVPEFYSDRAADVFANAELHIIEGGNHGFFGSQEDEALEATAAFLSEQIEQKGKATD